MKPKMEPNTGSLAVIGVDIGKEVFHLVGLGVDRKIGSPQRTAESGRRRSMVPGRGGPKGLKIARYPPRHR
jgi:hypothetical protein